MINLSFLAFKEELMSMFSIFTKEEVLKEKDSITGLTPELKVQYITKQFESKEQSVLFVCSSLYEAKDRKSVV